MKPRPVCRLAIVAAAAMLYASVGQAQDASYFNAPSAASSKDATDEAATEGFFVAPLGGTGLNAERARAYGGGLRLLPDSGAFIGYQMGNWTIGSALHRERDLERATWLDMSASYGLNLNRKHRISVDGGISVRSTTRDRDMNQPAHAFHIGEDADPGAGFRLSWRYNFDRNHYFSTTLGFDHRFGTSLYEGPDAERNAATFGTVYGYRFW